MTTTVLLADWDQENRFRMRAILEESDAEYWVVKDVDNELDLARRFSESAVLYFGSAVVLMDLAMPRTAMETALKVASGVRVLLMSSRPDMECILSGLAAGASGYINKESAKAELADAVQAVDSGRLYFDPAITDRLIVDYIRLSGVPSNLNRIMGLSSREHMTVQRLQEKRQVGGLTAGEAKDYESFLTRIRNQLVEQRSLQPDQQPEAKVLLAVMLLSIAWRLFTTPLHTGQIADLLMAVLLISTVLLPRFRPVRIVCVVLASLLVWATVFVDFYTPLYVAILAAFSVAFMPREIGKAKMLLIGVPLSLFLSFLLFLVGPGDIRHAREQFLPLLSLPAQEVENVQLFELTAEPGETNELLQLAHGERIVVSEADAISRIVSALGRTKPYHPSRGERIMKPWRMEVIMTNGGRHVLFLRKGPNTVGVEFRIDEKPPRSYTYQNQELHRVIQELGIGLW